MIRFVLGKDHLALIIELNDLYTDLY